MQAKRIKKLYGIDPKSWEHPADKAALSAVRQLKGIDELVKIVLSATTERSLKLIHLASSVKVTEKQFPKLNAMLNDIVDTFDWDYRPDMFVTQSPFLNAGVLGVKEPFILINSSVLRNFEENEIAAIIAHEMGHIMSGHALYKTLIWILTTISLSFLPGGELAVNAIMAVLAEWDRKSELTADRAEILATQDEMPSCNVLMKMAGAEDLSQVNLNEFFLQAKEYEDQKTVLDSIHKILNQVWQSHPFPVIRLQELKSWTSSGQYQRILDGEYPRKGESKASAQDDLKEAADFYRDSLKKSDDPIFKFMNAVGEGIEKTASDFGDRIKDVFKAP
ncbi:MAG TPA: M48 family metallopeptidase [Rectinemataceae bacterium]|nr:M48 family metallopeptidase [Rectinemataceae bacterium]